MCPEASPDQLVEILAIIAEHRGDMSGFEVVIAAADDHERDADVRAGATWWLTAADDLLARRGADGGPARSGLGLSRER
ncbi:hypothetical protein [Nocardia sp. MW-W600-9]